MNARESGKPRIAVIERISQGTPAQEAYARSIVNQADSIREQQREISIRPEMARNAIEQSRMTAEQTISPPVATIER